MATEIVKHFLIVSESRIHSDAFASSPLMNLFFGKKYLHIWLAKTGVEAQLQISLK